MAGIGAGSSAPFPPKAVLSYEETVGNAPIRAFLPAVPPPRPLELPFPLQGDVSLGCQRREVH